MKHDITTVYQMTGDFIVDDNTYVISFITMVKITINKHQRKQKRATKLNEQSRDIGHKKWNEDKQNTKNKQANKQIFIKTKTKTITKNKQPTKQKQHGKLKR